MEAELSSEVGAVGRLFKSCVDLYWALLQRILILKFKDRQKEALRDVFGKFYFWGDGFYPFEGRLDEILVNSSRLRNRLLAVLVEVGDILCSERTGTYVERAMLPKFILHIYYVIRFDVAVKEGILPHSTPESSIVNPLTLPSVHDVPQKP